MSKTSQGCVAWSTGLFELKRSSAARRRLRLFVSGQKFIALFERPAESRLLASPGCAPLPVSA